MSDNKGQAPTTKFKITLTGSLPSVAKYGAIQFLKGNRAARFSAALVSIGLVVLGSVVFLELTPIKSSSGILLGFAGLQLLYLEPIPKLPKRVMKPSRA